MFSYSWIVFQHFLLLLIVCYLKNCHFTIQGERDAISAKIEDSQAHLEMLEHTDILNDVFYISHYGIFGTINSLRLGHTHVVGIPIAKCKDKTLIHYILFEAHFEYSYVTLILGWVGWDKCCLGSGCTSVAYHGSVLHPEISVSLAHIMTVSLSLCSCYSLRSISKWLAYMPPASVHFTRLTILTVFGFFWSFWCIYLTILWLREAMSSSHLLCLLGVHVKIYFSSNNLSSAAVSSAIRGVLLLMTVVK